MDVATAGEYVRKRGTVRTRSSAGRMQELRRRSTRMALKARITLSGHDHAKCAFSMPAGATSLNKHGAAIQVNRELWVGSIIMLQNRQTQASARVVKQVSAHRQGFGPWGFDSPPGTTHPQEAAYFVPQFNSTRQGYSRGCPPPALRQQCRILGK